jgi:hypothetical protein
MATERASSSDNEMESGLGFSPTCVAARAPQERLAPSEHRRGRSMLPRCRRRRESSRNLT